MVNTARYFSVIHSPPEIAVCLTTVCFCSHLSDLCYYRHVPFLCTKLDICCIYPNIRQFFPNLPAEQWKGCLITAYKVKHVPWMYIPENWRLWWRGSHYRHGLLYVGNCSNSDEFSSLTVHSWIWKECKTEWMDFRFEKTLYELEWLISIKLYQTGILFGKHRNCCEGSFSTHCSYYTAICQEGLG